MRKVDRKALLVVGFIALFFFVFSGVSAAAEFSADLVVKTKDEGEMTGKIFVKGEKVRQEWTDEGETQILIVRPDKKVTYMITPEEKMYMEIPYESEESKGFEEWTPEREKKAKVVGEDTVSGQKCKKYEMVEDEEKITYCVSSKYPFPIKVEDSESVMEYRNIKEGSVADSLFEIPSGYERMPGPTGQ